MRIKKKIIKRFAVLIALVALFVISYSAANAILGFYDFSDFNKMEIISVKLNETKKHVWPSQRKIDVDSVSLFVIPDFAEKEITGVEKIYGRKQKGVGLKFNFTDEGEISCLKLNGKKVGFVSVNNHVIVSGGENDTVFAIKIKYKVKPRGGLYFAERKGEAYVYTVNEPIFASRWFVCNDTPTDKFTLTFSARVENSKTVVSNGRKRSERKLGKEKIITWRSSYPLASYSVAFYCGNYSLYKTGFNGTDIEIYAFPEHSLNSIGIAAAAKEALSVFEEKFGEYPFKRDKFSITETAWNYGGMENQTAICLGKKFFNAEYFKDIIVHETAHEWFGNYVSVSDWGDVWINEGLATFCEALYWEKIAGAKGYEAAVKSFETAGDCGKIRNREKNLFARIVYDKGALVFHELRKTYGDEKFFGLMRSYLDKHKYGAANFTELKKYFDFGKLSDELRTCFEEKP